MPYYSVKTTASHEQTVVDMILNKANDEVVAGLAPENMRGYVLLESTNPSEIERVIEEVPHAQKLLRGEASEKEVLDFLSPTSDVENVAEGDLVEMTDGPYQGEKATVQKIDRNNSRVTVELQEATVPIPIEMAGNNVRRLDSEERDT